MFVIQQFGIRDPMSLPLYFRTKDGALAFRDNVIGTDDGLCLCDGIWELTRIGPNCGAAGELTLKTLETWKYIGRWDTNGNDHTVIRIERQDR